MKAVILGANGQLGYELQQTAPSAAEVFALGRSECDLSAPERLSELLGRMAPDVVINAAAYTAVDKAETDIDSAYAVNARGVDALAQACAALGIKLVHVSTDFVFDGNGSNYAETVQPRPLSVYGASKLAGEQAIAASGASAVIIRTAWVYSAHGNNFVKTMLRLMAEKDSLGVVCDQRGTPTWANGLAEACWALAQTDAKGIYHYTDSGECSWYDFAVEIQAQALALGLLQTPIPINAIPSSSYPTPAQRPANSVLDKTRISTEQGIKIKDWQGQLNQMLRQLV